MQQESAKLGRYRLVQRLAAGGMAEVYLARMQSDGGLEKTVVVKTILPELTGNEQLRVMMLDEARIGFALRHQNIAQVLDVGRQGDTIYVAIEYIDGLDLARMLRACDRADLEIDPMLVAYIGVEVLRALDYAHRRRNDAGEELHIVHRDVSPHNVLVSVEGEVKLTDFGIARARDRLSRTTTAGTKGKLAYMPPEQARGEEIDHRADLFGVGATLYELLCGSPPFEGRSELEVLRALERGEIRPLAERKPDLDPLLVGVVEAALQPDPQQRPASAAEMRRPLEELLRGHAVSADTLAELVRSAREAARQAADRDAAFHRALLGAGTDTGSIAGAGIAAGTPTAATLPAARAGAAGTAVVGPRASRLPWAVAAVAVIAAAAVAVVVAMRGGGEKAADNTAAVAAVAADAAVGDGDGNGDGNGVAIAAIDAGVPVVIEQPPKPPPRRAKAKPKPKRKETAAAGTISITSLPWARVTIDGKYVGNTPLQRKSLPAGEHEVRLSNPETGQSAKRTVKIVGGEHSTLRLKL